MRRRTALWVLVAGVTVVALIAVGWSLHTDALARESHTSEYDFELRIDTDATLDDVTIYAPLPDGPVGSVATAGDLDARAGWSVSVVDHERGRLLRVVADRIDPPPRPPTTATGSCRPSRAAATFAR